MLAESQSSPIAGVVHRLLVRSVDSVQRFPGGYRVWNAAYKAACRRWGDHVVTLTLHGQRARINFANPYPVTSRRFANYNAPQVELVTVAAEALGRPVRVIDVGAAVGDTALLLLERCGPMIESLDCVEGERRFARLLRSNLADDRVRIHELVLANHHGMIPALVRSSHEGTASARGSEQVQASTLDDVFKDLSPDVVKVDTDGYDGLILDGGRRLLARAHPAVLFEWAPRHCVLAGTDPALAFQVLREVGYDRWVFFTKYGQFSHFGDACLTELARLCSTSTTLPDWHYDVVALHATSEIDQVELANLSHWGGSGYD